MQLLQRLTAVVPSCCSSLSPWLTNACNKYRRYRNNNIHHSDSETIHGLALSLESIDDILGGDCLTLGVVCVDEGVTDDDIQEGLQHLTSLWIDCGGNTLYSTTTS